MLVLLFYLLYLCKEHIWAKDLWTTFKMGVKDGIIMLNFIIILQKDSFILVLIYDVSFNVLRLHVQFSHNSNNVLENHIKLVKMYLLPTFEGCYYAYYRLDLVWKRLSPKFKVMKLPWLFSRHYSLGLPFTVLWSNKQEIIGCTEKCNSYIYVWRSQFHDNCSETVEWSSSKC